MNTSGEPAGIIDTHVHLMPERLLAAIRRAINEQAGWQFEHAADQAGIERALVENGVDQYFALPYAHAPGMAAELNAWVIDAAAESEMAIPFATVHADDSVNRVVRDAFDAGARGLKFQCPVQECAPDDPRLDPAYELAAEYDRPIIFHAGTAPFYEDSPHVGAARFESFVESYPEIRACAAHMGTHEVEAFVEFAAEYESVYLDTAYVLSEPAGQDMGFDPQSISDDVFETYADSIMFGTDYPNVTFPYHLERDALLDRNLTESALSEILRGTAQRFLGAGNWWTKSFK